MQDTPIITFVNKMDRYGLPPLDILEDIEETLDVETVPLSWPIGMGSRFRGTYSLYRDELHLLSHADMEGEHEHLPIVAPGDLVVLLRVRMSARMDRQGEVGPPDFGGLSGAPSRKRCIGSPLGPEMLICPPVELAVGGALLQSGSEWER